METIELRTPETPLRDLEALFALDALVAARNGKPEDGDKDEKKTGDKTQPVINPKPYKPEGPKSPDRK
jgi:hypothetical protein